MKKFYMAGNILTQGKVNTEWHILVHPVQKRRLQVRVEGTPLLPEGVHTIVTVCRA